MRRRQLLRFGAVAVAGPVAGCNAGSPPRNVAVAMTDQMSFEPEAVNVALGGTITWQSVGEVAHTVTAYERELPIGASFFASGGFATEQGARANLEAGLIESGDTYEHTFETRGIYGYYCIPHEGSGMTGTIRVR